MNDQSTHSRFLSENFLKQVAKDLRPHPAKTISPESSVEQLVLELATLKVGCLLVVEEERCVGIVSERDVLHAVSQSPADWSTLQVSSIMTRDVESVPRHGSLARILYVMDLRNIRHVVVKSSGSKSLAVLSIKDVIDFLYHRLGQRIATSTVRDVGDVRVLEQFFESLVDSLKPAEPRWVNEQTPTRNVVRELSACDAGSLLIQDEAARLVGIFTERDLMRVLAAYGSEALEQPVREAMTKTPYTIFATSTISMAFNLFSSRGFRHLPVVDDEERLVGVLSAKHFLRVLSQSVMKELEEGG